MQTCKRNTYIRTLYHFISGFVLIAKCNESNNAIFKKNLQHHLRVEIAVSGVFLGYLNQASHIAGDFGFLDCMDHTYVPRMVTVYDTAVAVVHLLGRPSNQCPTHDTQHTTHDRFLTAANRSVHT